MNAIIKYLIVRFLVVGVAIGLLWPISWLPPVGKILIALIFSSVVSYILLTGHRDEIARWIMRRGSRDQ